MEKSNILHMNSRIISHLGKGIWTIEFGRTLSVGVFITIFLYGGWNF
jgi:hypothetical protein